ncbi:MAG: hypothetical protein JF610_01695 [Acidobacteria bacterium]|nr:hypothetical protein [Acidobacteriota bacterium]
MSASSEMSVATTDAAVENGLDDDFGRGAGDQHGRRHFEVEPPELARADDVGERLTRGAPRDQ